MKGNDKFHLECGENKDVIFYLSTKQRVQGPFELYPCIPVLRASGLDFRKIEEI